MKKDNYEDIINLSHYVSTRYPRMKREARAAQFAPFAALAGHADAIEETARLTDKKIEISEEIKQILNNKLQIIFENIKEQPEVMFTYFEYDNKKTGGKYVNVIGNVRKIDMAMHYVLLVDKRKIPIKEIINISGDLFKKSEIDII